MAIGVYNFFDLSGTLVINDGAAASRSWTIPAFTHWGKVINVSVRIGLTHTFADDLDFLLLVT
jgi:hypothetical protein